MKRYFYAHEGKSNGPFAKEELVGKINPETLMWYEGLHEWKKALEIPELLSLFQSIPPPIPIEKTNNSKQVEVLLKKEKKKPINAKSQVLFAKEIKQNAFLFIISIVLALIGFIYKAQTENGEYSSLLNKYKTYQRQSEKFYENEEFKRIFGSDDPVLMQREEEMAKEDSEKLTIMKNELDKESNRLNCCKSDFSWSDICNPRKTMQNIENYISYGYRLAKKFSFKIFFISLIILIIGRYSIKSIKWVRDTSS